MSCVVSCDCYTCIQLEQMYKDAHAKIRADPSFTKKPPREDVKKKRFVYIPFVSLTSMFFEYGSNSPFTLGGIVPK